MYVPKKMINSSQASASALAQKPSAAKCSLYAARADSERSSASKRMTLVKASFAILCCWLRRVQILVNLAIIVKAASKSVEEIQACMGRRKVG